MLNSLKRMLNKQTNKVDENSEYQVIKQSGLFDEHYYIEAYQLDPNVDAIQHYIDEGVFNLNNPSDAFCTDFYLCENADVKQANVNPFFHYIKYGIQEGRAPIKNTSTTTEIITDFATQFILPRATSEICSCSDNLFCNAIYKGSYNDLDSINIEESLTHYLQFGINEARVRHLNEVFYKYLTNYNESFLSALGEDIHFFDFIKNYVEEADLTSFLNFYFQTCNLKSANFFFDIFDTVIYREVYEPADIFSLVELQSQIWGFSKMRIDAEEKCKAAFGDKQYLLTDIYNEIPLSESEKVRLYQLELNVERENIKLRPAVFDFVKTLLSKGFAVNFISDYYLVKSELLQILPEEFVSQFGDAIHVSGDSGYCKHSGELYEYLIEQKFIDVNEMNYMIGDNGHSDYAVAKKYHFSKAFWLPTINDTSLKKYTPFIESSDTLIGRSIKVNAINNDKVYIPILANTMIGLAKYINKLSLVNQDSSVLFLGRDGHLLHKVYEVMFNEKSVEIANSRTLNFCSIIDDLDDFEQCMSRDGFPTKIGNKLFNRLGLKLGVNFNDLDDNLMRSNGTITNSLLPTVLQHCSKQRELYRRYIDSKVVNTEQCIVFDIGYRGTSAKAFSKIYPNSDLNWIYFMTFKDMSFEHTYDAIVPEVDLEKYGQVIPILETIFSDAKSGSAHYFNNQELVRKSSSSDHELQSIVTEVQDEVIKFVKNYIVQGGGNLSLNYHSVSNVLDYLLHPELSFSKKFLGLKNEDSFANATSYYISPKLLREQSSWLSGYETIISGLN